MNSCGVRACARALADRWGVTDSLPPRTTVWAELTLPAPQSPERERSRSGPPCDPYAPPTRRKHPTKPHPSLPPGKLTPASEYAQVGWIRDGLPALRSAPAAPHHSRHVTAPAGSAIPDARA